MLSMHEAFEHTWLLNPPYSLRPPAQTPSGHVTWEDLRHVLNCVVVKLSDSEFNELKQTFDPEGTGTVKINSLLDVLDDSPKVGPQPSLGWVTPETKRPSGLREIQFE